MRVALALALVLAPGCEERCVDLGEAPGCEPIRYCCVQADGGTLPGEDPPEDECEFEVDHPNGTAEFKCEAADDCEEAHADAIERACFLN